MTDKIHVCRDCLQGCHALQPAPFSGGNVSKSIFIPMLTFKYKTKTGLLNHEAIAAHSSLHNISGAPPWTDYHHVLTAPHPPTYSTALAARTPVLQPVVMNCHVRDWTGSAGHCWMDKSLSHYSLSVSVKTASGGDFWSRRRREAVFSAVGSMAPASPSPAAHSMPTQVWSSTFSIHL